MKVPTGKLRWVPGTVMGRPEVMRYAYPDDGGPIILQQLWEEPIQTWDGASDRNEWRDVEIVS